MKMQLLAAVKLTFHREKNCLWGKEIGDMKKKKKESTSFGSALKTGETQERIHMWLSPILVA